jgi:hypothetical protein
MADLKNRIVQRPIIAHVRLRFFHRMDSYIGKRHKEITSA